MFLSICLFSCLHFEIISDFLLSNFSLNLTLCFIMYSFSVTHRLHFFFLILINNNTCWIKKDNSTFDVTMVSFDGAETSELVGLYLLHNLQNIIPNHEIGLYRDDGLAAIGNTSGPEMERIRKKIFNYFKQEGLKVSIKTNLTQVDYLDVTLDLISNSFRPYTKPNNSTLYVKSTSNHPKTIKDNIPSMIYNRISSLSQDEKTFNNAIRSYKEALKNSVYNEEFLYNSHTNKSRKSRKRKVSWFNPPFSNSVKTKIGKEFFKIEDNNFPPHHRYAKIFNKNTLKLSYSCMPNFKTIIASH